jgi:hypothetical protein
MVVGLLSSRRTGCSLMRPGAHDATVVVYGIVRASIPGSATGKLRIHSLERVDEEVRHREGLAHPRRPRLTPRSVVCYTPN